MDRSGLGLLPGIVIAMVVVLAGIAALLLDSMWVVFLVLGLLGLVTVAVVGVVIECSASAITDTTLGSRASSEERRRGAGPASLYRRRYPIASRA